MYLISCFNYYICHASVSSIWRTFERDHKYLWHITIRRNSLSKLMRWICHIYFLCSSVILTALLHVRSPNWLLVNNEWIHIFLNSNFVIICCRFCVGPIYPFGYSGKICKETGYLFHSSCQTYRHEWGYTYVFFINSKICSLIAEN